MPALAPWSEGLPNLHVQAWADREGVFILGRLPVLV